VEIPFVGSPGAPAAIPDLRGGHIPRMVEAPPVLVPLVHAGRVRAYAASTPVRSSALPDVPTFAESGYPDLSETSWFALWARPGVPAAAQEALRAAALHAQQLPQARARLADLGMDPGLPLTAAELARDVREAYERQAKVLQAIHFSPR
jgi:tripartite-type tricarboxylate transporter receptor subunit TctC